MLGLAAGASWGQGNQAPCCLLHVRHCITCASNRLLALGEVTTMHSGLPPAISLPYQPACIPLVPPAAEV